MKYIIIILLVLSTGLSAQVAHYSWDNCDGVDNALLQSDAILNNINCDCGVLGQSAVLNGANASIELPASLSTIFDSDFSIEFYFLLENTGSADVDILSFASSCTADSTFAVRYLPPTEEITVSLSENFNARIAFNTKLEASNCWHHFLLTKTELEYNFYLNNEHIGTELAPKGLSIAKNAQFGFATSPCLAINEERMLGKIDEFKIYKRSLSALEANSNYLAPGLIFNRDTTIFAGSSVALSAGANCAQSISWTPSSSLSVSNEFNTIATPEESTTYSLTTVAADGCTQVDTVRIYVLQEGDIACENLLLPTAFTPNGDLLNDTYGISNNFIIESLNSFEIFDRWGTKVFETNIPQQGWDGNFDGQAVNSGNFIYKINYTCRGQEYNKLGSFAVLR